MAITVRGPDGAVHTFPDGTDPEVIRRAIGRHYGNGQPQRQAAAQAAQASRERRNQPQRSLWERLTDRLDNSLQSSYGAFARWMVSRGIEGEYAVRDPETGQVIERRTDDNQAIRQMISSTERQRRADLDARTKGDEWYRAPGGVVGRGAAGLATASGELIGAAMDPTSWIGWGRTLLVKAGSAGLTNAGADALAQAADIDLDIQKEFDEKRLLLAAATGAAISSLGDLAGKGVNALTRRFLQQPEAASVVDLEVGDELNVPALAQTEIAPTPPRRDPVPEPEVTPPAPERPAAAPERPAQGPREEAPQGDAPRPQEGPDGAPEGRSLVTAEAPKGGDGAGGWTDVDWGARKSPERVAAAIRHLDGLKQWIKPEAVQAFLRALDNGIPPASEGVHINEKWVDWDKMGGDPDAILGLTNAISDIFSDVYSKAGDARQGWAETAKIAKQMGFTLSDIIKTHADITGEGGITARAGALRDAALASDKAFYDQLKLTQAAMAKGDLSGVSGLAESLHRTIILGAMDAGASSEIARALQYRKRAGAPKFPKNDLQAAVDEINTILNKGGDIDEAGLGKVFEELTKAYEKGGSSGMRQAVRQMREMGFWDYATYYATASLLSAPTTHIRNAFGTPIHALFQIGERYVAAGIGAARLAVGLGSKERVTFREALAYTSGLTQAWAEGLTLGGRAFLKGAPVSDVRSSVMPDNMAAQVPFAFSPERAAEWRAKPLSPRTWADVTGVVVFELQRTLGFRASVATDELYKALGRRMQVNALSYREAAYRAALVDPSKADKVFKDSLKALQEQPTDAAHREARQFFEGTGQSPDGVFEPGSREEEMALILRSIDHQQMAADHAQLLAFQTSGPIVEKLDAALRAVPIIKGLWVNFVRTPVAILKAGMVDRNPVIGGAMAVGELTTRKGREKHKALFDALTSEEQALSRGGAEADLVLARQALGAAVLSSVWMLWAGGSITGKQTEQERQSGVLDYSFRLPNGEWVQYSGMSPLGEMLGLVADTAAGLRRVDIGDDDMFAVVGAVAAAVRNNIVNKTFLKGVSDFMEMMTGGQYGAQTNESGGEQMSKAAAEALAPRVVPGGALLRRVAQDQDPVTRDARGFIEMLLAGLPGQTESLAAKRDFMGRPILRKEGERGVLQAFNTSRPTADPLERELGRLALTLGESFRIGLPPRKLNGEDLTPREYSLLLETQGQLYRVRGKNMEETLRELISDPDYRASDPDAQAFQVKRVIERFREGANKAARNPRSPLYMAEAARRTGGRRLEVETRRRGWTEGQAMSRAQQYGLAPGDPELEELRDALFPPEEP